MIQSTPQYFEKRIEILERKVEELQLKIEKLMRNKMLSDRQIEAIERRVDL